MDQKLMLETWKKQLGGLFPEREIRNLFYLALEDVLGINRGIILSNQVGVFSEKQVYQLQEVLKRLETGEPIQYIVGFTYFDDLKIKVGPGVLIPRPETEELVVLVQETVQNRKKLKVIDWCTGSGCIALAFKKRNPGFDLTGFDISPEALEIARSNAQELNLEVEFRKNDALDPENNQKADVIISNPPYIPWNEKAEMHQNVLEFEPDLALFVPNESPLLFYKSIARYGTENLNNSGYLFFELHENYAFETKVMVEKLGFHSVEVKQDLQGKNRMLKAQWK